MPIYLNNPRILTHRPTVNISNAKVSANSSKNANFTIQNVNTFKRTSVNMEKNVNIYISLFNMKRKPMILISTQTNHRNYQGNLRNITP
jgi:hypothetical protein